MCLFVGKHMSSSKKTQLKTVDLCKNFASQSTTHGVRRILETESNFGKFVWTVIFLTALAGCTYHCSFLILKYLRYEKVTTTEEIHSKELEFPALTVCNLNILKKNFLVDQLAKNDKKGFNRGKGMYNLKLCNIISIQKKLVKMYMYMYLSQKSKKHYHHVCYSIKLKCYGPLDYLI